MWLPRSCALLIILSLARCENTEEQEDPSMAFVEAAKSFFSIKENLNGFQGLARSLVQSGMGKQLNEVFDAKTSLDSLGQMMSGIGDLFTGNENRPTIDLSMFKSVLDGLMSKPPKRTARDVETQQQQPLMDLNNIFNMFGDQSGNSELLMGLLPMLLQGFGNNEPGKLHDHSGHSWFMPPILENLHVMWDHFSNSELGQTLWKNSGLSQFVGQISDSKGRIQYEKLLDSFEEPAVRRKWIRALTNYIGEWLSFVSDPQIQQRYLNTIQFVGNSFLKSQGFPKSAMFDSMRPVESFSRLVNAVVKRHLGMKIDSSQYVKPAEAYIKELIALASEKGFIMSRVNAREISNRLSDTLNYDIIDPILKSYRAYKWAIKRPQCANQILCTINEQNDKENQDSRLRSSLLKVSSYPAAWAASNKLGISFWTLYGAIMDHTNCVQKYPAECTDFHEEEIRITTESIHSEL